MAGKYALQAEISSFNRAVLLKRFYAVVGAGWIISTGRWEHGAEHLLIDLDGYDQDEDEQVTKAF